jgi:hypothetical protein
MSRFITAAAVFACTIVLPACDAQTLEEDHTTRSGITEVVVDVSVGSVVVSGTKDTQAKAHVEATFATDDFRPAIDFREEGSKLFVSANCGDAEDIPYCRTDIELSMPAGAILRVAGVEADISVEDLTGAIYASTEYGNIDLDTVTGALDLSVREGNIIGDNIYSSRTIADTYKGRIDLVFLGLPWNIDTSTARGDIKLTMPKLTYQVLAKTASGTVDIRVPQSSTSRRLVKADIAESGSILVGPTDSSGGAM